MLEPHSIDPKVENYVEAALRDTRHDLRNEMMAIVREGVELKLQANSKYAELHSQHIEIKADLASLRREIAALAAQRAAIRNWFIAQAGLVVAALGVVVAVVR